jgi:uncharacterized membrane protein (Fun14 family)
MGKMNKKSAGFMFCFAAGIVWGVLIGAVITAMIVSYRVDLFYEKIAYQESVIEDNKEKLKKLEKSINNSNIVLKDINIIIEADEELINSINNIEIEKAIKEKFTSSLGKEVKNLDAEILMEVIDKRILKFDEAEYRIDVKKLYLSDTLKIWVEITVMEIESKE